MVDFEAIASLIQQTLTHSQPELLADNIIQTIVQKAIAKIGLRSSHVVTEEYDSQWTEAGVIVDSAKKSLSWEKRPSLDPAYRCQPITRLLNRQQEINVAIATLQAGGIVTSSGSGGMGKTALLRALCYHPQLTPRFPGGILYQQVYDRPLEDIWQGVFDALFLVQNSSQHGINVVAKPSQAVIHQRLAQQHICVVLDEFEGSKNQLQSLANWSYEPTRLPLMVALSNPATPDDKRLNGRRLALKGLSIQDAVILLEESLGRSLQSHEQQHAHLICQHLSGHPRRLMQLASLVRQNQCSFAELSHQLQQGTSGDRIMLKIMNNLPDPGRRIIAILAVLQGAPLHLNHLPTLIGLPQGKAPMSEHLKRLIHYGIVWTDGTYYRLAQNLAETIQCNWNLKPWTDQVIKYFDAWLTQLTTPSILNTETVVPIQANNEILWTVLCLAIRQQQWSTALSMSAPMERGFWLSKQWGRWQQVLLLQWLAARSLHNRAAEATVLHQLGSRCLCLGDHVAARAYLNQAFQYRQNLGDTDSAAITQHNLSLLEKHHPSTSLLKQKQRLINSLPSTIGLIQDTQDKPRAYRSPQDEGTPSQISRQAGLSAASSPPASETKAPESPSGDAHASATTDDSVILTSPSWFSWSRIAMGVGAIAAFGVGLFLLQQRSFEYGLRTRHNFSPQRTGIPSEPFFFSITNTTPGSLPISVRLTSGDEGEFRLDSEDCTEQPLAPEETCALKAIFVPQEAGPQEAIFTVGFGQVDEPKTIRLTGVGADIDAELRPNDMTFGQQLVDERSKSQTITFRNKGAVSFTVGQASLRQDFDNVFSLDKDLCSQQVLQPRDSCSLTFSFLPTEETAYQAMVDIIDDTGDEVWSVALTGTGIKLPAPVSIPTPPRTSNRRPVSRSVPPSPRPTTPRATTSISPQALTFGEKDLGAQTTETVVVRNTGNQILTINESILSDTAAFTLSRDTCTNAVLQPNDTCAVDITFNSLSAEIYEASLIIVDGSGERLHRIAVNGVGAIPENLPLPIINSFTVNPSAELLPTDTVELCYSIANAAQAYILSSATGERINLSSAAEGCITQVLGTSTNYTLVALNHKEENDMLTVGVSVIKPDVQPPTTPMAIAPTGENSTVYCTSDIDLEWTSSTDDRSLVSYTVRLQRRDVPTVEANGTTQPESAVPEWVSLPSITTSQTKINLSNVTAPFTYRWKVQAADEAGNISESSPWQQFWCIVP